MRNLSYNLSAGIQKSLGIIETQRRQILLAPLTPKQELQLRWEATLERLYYTLQLTGNSLPKKEIVRLLSSPPRARLKIEEQEVINYKKALDYLSQEWILSNKPVNLKVVSSLHRLVIKSQPFRVPQKPLKQLLNYLQAQPENPITQAGIAFIGLPHFKQYQRLAHLLAYLFLYKSGLDFRGLLALEKHFAADQAAFQHVTDFALKTQNLTLWLEYFTQATINQLEEAISKTHSPVLSPHLPPASFWKLNKRQKAILSLLNQPNITITNRQVQKIFKVSQITASRDLARLKNLNLVFSHGQGRSTSYSRA
jgi:Fic family protein